MRDFLSEGLLETYSFNSLSAPGRPGKSRSFLPRFPLEKYSYAHEWAKSNDVPALVRARLNLPFGTDITSSNLEVVMTEYMRAWNSGIR